MGIHDLMIFVDTRLCQKRRIAVITAVTTYHIVCVCVYVFIAKFVPVSFQIYDPEPLYFDESV